MADNEDDGLRSRGAQNNTDRSNGVDDSETARNYSPRRNHIDQDSIDPASIHALHTAFSSLQRTHNEQSRKFQELLQRNNIMQKTLMDINYGNRDFDVPMDDMYGPDDPSMAHAAGATGEVTAENRAKQGYLAHLERQVMQRNWTISQNNEQIKLLKQIIDKLEREKARLLAEVETARASLQQNYEILHERDREIAEMKIQMASLKAGVPSRTTMNEETDVEMYERSPGISDNSSELQNVRSRLSIAENHLQKVHTDCREKDAQLKEREKQVMALEAKCTQFQIEVDIAKNNRAAANNALDTDTDIKKLSQALELISTQRSVIAGLRQQVEVQGSQIEQLCTTHKTKDVGKLPEVREAAQGSSLCPAFREQAGPMYMNIASVGNLSHSPQQDVVPALAQCEIHTAAYNDETDSPKEEDLFDVRCEVRNSPAYNVSVAPRDEVASPYYQPNLNRVTNSPRLNDAIITHSPRINDTITHSPRINDAITNSPRINDAIMPIGNVKTMMATEMPQQVQKLPANKVDCATSPQMRMSQSMYSPSITSVGRVGELHNSPSFRNREMRSSLSPSNMRHQQASHTEVTISPTEPSARHKTGTLRAYENQPLSPANTGSQMSRSEIIYRHDRSTPEENVMTRSVLEPLQPLIIAPEKVTRSEYRYQPCSDTTPQTAYDDNIPNYENIYNEQQQTEIKRPLVDDDTVFVNSSDFLPKEPPTITSTYENVSLTSDRTREAVRGYQDNRLASVSDLKICPVCNQEFSRLTMDQFQTHVFECFDNCDDNAPLTLQAPGDAAQDDDRTCPMCGDTFPLTIPQETFEVHVLGHFGEEPIVERFEMVGPGP